MVSGKITVPLYCQSPSLELGFEVISVINREGNIGLLHETGSPLGQGAVSVPALSPVKAVVPKVLAAAWQIGPVGEGRIGKFVVDPWGGLLHLLY